MIKDSILEKSNTRGGKVWGRYNNIYNWIWNKEGNKPTIYPLSLENSIMTGAVMVRDWQIAQKLSELGIKKALDIGSDTGHLMATLKACGIDSVGIDASIDASKYINDKGVNTCYNLSIQDLIKLEKIDDGYDCLICLNITHARWQDEKLKEDFINWSGRRFKYCVLSNISRQDRKWNNLDLIYSFNIGKFKYNKFLQYAYRLLGIDPILHYSGIQKIYRSKIIK